MEAVWGDTFVEETNLRYSVHSLRKAFDEDFIETVPKRGYRFNAGVKVFTKEEFIRKHTDLAIEDSKSGSVEPVSVRETPRQNPWVIVGAIGFSLVTAVVVTSLGFSVYKSNNEDPKSEFITSLAVIPITEVGKPNVELKGFESRLNDQLVSNLQKLSDVRVEPVDSDDGPRTSDLERYAIGRTLGADRILTGTSRLEENVLTVNFRILDATRRSAVVNKTITIEKDKFPEVENTVALRIAREVSKHTMSLRDEREIKDIELDQETRDSYLLAQKIPREDEFSRWYESSNILRNVVAKYPNWALAKGKLAEALVLVVGRKGCSEARKFANEALELDQENAESHFVIGYCAQFRWKWKVAEDSFRKAIKYKPNFTRAYLEYGHVLDTQKKFAESGEAFRKLLELSPLSAFYYAAACEHFYFDQNFDEAEKQCVRAEQLEPGYRISRYHRRNMYVYRNQAQKIYDLEFGDQSPKELLSNPYARALKNGDVKKYVRLLVNDPKKSATAIGRAGWYAYLGGKAASH